MAECFNPINLFILIWIQCYLRCKCTKIFVCLPFAWVWIRNGTTTTEYIETTNILQFKRQLICGQQPSGRPRKERIRIDLYWRNILEPTKLRLWPPQNSFYSCWLGRNCLGGKDLIRTNTDAEEPSKHLLSVCGGHGHGLLLHWWKVWHQQGFN